jgi:hypothetical protein
MPISENLVIFPQINPIQFKMVEQLFADTIPAHEEQVWFDQKAQFDDVFYAVFAVPAASPYTVAAGLYDCLGTLRANYACDIITQSVTADYIYYKMTMQFASGIVDSVNNGIDEGVYFVKLTFTGDTDPPRVYLFTSEPIYVKENWPATGLLRYRNEINDFDILFTVDPTFYFQVRVEGGFPSAGFKPESKDEIFIDQNNVPTMLDSIPYVVKQIQFGAGCGIPNYHIDAINRSLSCTHWYWNGVRYCKNEGAKLEPTHSSQYPMSGWVIDVIGVADDFDTNFNLSKIYVLGSGYIAYRSGDGYSFFSAPPID